MASSDRSYDESAPRLGFAMGWSGLASSVNYISTVIGGLLIARGLNKTDYGHVTYIVWFLSTITTVGVLGIPYGMSIRISKSLANSNEYQARNIYARGILLCLALFVIVLVTVVSIDNLALSNLSHPLTILPMVPFVMGIMLRPVLLTWHSAKLDYRTQAYVNILASIAFVVGAAVVSWDGAPTVAMLTYGAKQFIPMLLLIPLSISIINKRSNEKLLGTKLDSSFWSLSLEHWLMLVGTTLIWSRFEIGLLKFLSTDNHIASFNVGLQIVGPVSKAVTLFTAPVGLYCSRKHALNEEKRLVDTTNTLIRFLGMVSGLVAIIIAGSSPLVLPFLLGQRYLESLKIIPLLAFATWFYSLISVLSAVSQGVERPRFIILAVLGSAPLFVGTAWVMIPRFGALGASVARSVSHLVSFLILWLTLAKYIPGILPFRDFIQLVIVIGIPLLSLTFVSLLLPGIVVFFISLVGLMWVFIVNHIVGIVTQSDILSFQHHLVAKLPFWAEKIMWRFVSLTAPSGYACCDMDEIKANEDG